MRQAMLFFIYLISCYKRSFLVFYCWSAATIQQPIGLFEPITTEEGANVVKYLNKINSVTKEDKNYSHPAIIGSRAAAFWMDFYRTRDYRDTVATRIQAMKLIEENHASSKLNIKLIVHSLDTSDTRRKPLPEDAKQRIATPPRLLFKVTAKKKKPKSSLKLKSLSMTRNSL